MSKQVKTLIREMVNKPLFRTFTISSVDEENRTVELTFSSETPVTRWFGREVLDHGGGSVRLERLQNGASALVNHNWNDLVGVVESAELSERKGRALVRFGKSDRAEEIWQDVKDGIRRQISVGYFVHKMELESEEGDVRTYRVTDWEPYEISFVTVAADPTVGTRAADLPENYLTQLREMGLISNEPDAGEPEPEERSNPVMKQKNLRDASGRLVRASVDEAGNIVEVLEVIEEADASRDAGRQDEIKRCQRIYELFDQYGSRGVDPKPFIMDSDKTPEDYQRALLDAAANGPKKRSATPVAEDDDPNIGLTEREIDNYSFVNVLRYLSKPDNMAYRKAVSFELEASEAAADKMGRDAQGIMVPHDVLRAAAPIKKTGSGGKLVGTDHMDGSFIEMLYNKSAVMGYCTTLTGLVGDADIPAQEGGATGYWVGEDSDVTLSETTFGQRKLTNKTCGAMVEMTRRMLKQSSPDVEMLVRSDIAKALALTIDKAALYGAGTDEPTGLANMTGVNGVDFTAEDPTYEEIVKMETEIAADNADIGSMVYLMNAGGRGHLKTKEKFTSANGATIWEPGNYVNGYGTRVSNQVTKGDYWFGVWSELVVALWGGLDLTLDPYTNSSKGRLRIVAMQDADVIARHPAAFCLGKKPSA